MTDDLIAGRYRLGEKIGEGGMGEVYRASDESLGRDVAIKFLPRGVEQDTERLRRFTNEARAASALNHPHILTVYEIGTADGRPFIATEFIDGRTLRERLRDGPLAADEARRVAQQVALALGAAHEKGIVHRDIKPENVMVRRDGYVKVLDFGLARLTSGSGSGSGESPTRTQLTRAGTVLGTGGYMSPEQVQGLPADHRSDIWAVGVLLYEMLAGQRPFRGETPADTMRAVLMADPPPLPGADGNDATAALERILQRCLRKNPAERYQSARELASALEGLTSSSGVRAAPIARRPLAWMAGGAVAAVMLAVAILLYRQRAASPAGHARIQSLAVLPLTNLSGDASQEYFADGMTEAVIANLAQIKSIRVISRTSVARFKDSKKSLPEIAAELKVDAVVEGSAMRAGDRVRITARLIDAGERHLWTKSYEQSIGDILSLQREVARTIAGEVAAVITPQEARQLNAAASVDLQAYDEYLQGRYLLNRGTKESVLKAIERFKHAIALDPQFAGAHAGLSDAYSGLRFVYVAPRLVMPQAEASALKAIELDDGLAEAHVSLGMVHLFFRYDWPKAEAEFLRAIALNPNLSEAHRLYADLLATLGRHPEAITEMTRAQALDPVSLMTVNDASWIYYLAGQYERSLEVARRAIDLEPGFWISHVSAGTAYEQLGRYAEGIAELEKARQLDANPFVLEMLGGIYATAGRRKDAEAVLAELRQMADKQYVCPYEVATVYAVLGDRKAALEWLEKSYNVRADCQPWVNVDPKLAELRKMPQFLDLVRRTGIKP